MKNIFALAAIGTLLLVSGSRLDAQNKRMGTAAASELLIPVGGRDLARGGSSISSSEGIEAIYWNPAGLGRMQKSAEGMFSSMSYIADIRVNYGAVAGSFGDFGVIGLSLKSIDLGEIPITTNDDPEGNSARLYSPAYVTVGLSYARGLTPSISAGGTFKIIVEHLDQAFASGVAFDLGVQYQGLVGVQGLNLGVAVKNIGPQMTFEGPGLLGTGVRADGRRPAQKYSVEAAGFELPAVLEIGLGYDQKVSDNMEWNVTSSFSNRNLGLDEYRFGGEVGYNFESVQLFGRAGLNLVPQSTTDEENIFGSTFGIGVLYRGEGVDVSIDYAYRSVKYFDGNQILSLKFGF
jgi:hypothetical protein